MAYDFATRLDYLGKRMRKLHVNQLLYLKPSTGQLITVTSFTPEKIDVTQLGVYGVTLITDKAQDVIFDAFKLSVLSPPLPEQGHQLTWNGTVYEVFSIGDEVYRHVTSSRKRIRIHTKQISSDAVGILMSEDGYPILSEDGKFIPLG
jgi:hypothetical protein